MKQNKKHTHTNERRKKENKYKTANEINRCATRTRRRRRDYERRRRRMVIVKTDKTVGSPVRGLMSEDVRPQLASARAGMEEAAVVSVPKVSVRSHCRWWSSSESLLASPPAKHSRSPPAERSREGNTLGREGRRSFFASCGGTG